MPQTTAPLLSLLLTRTAGTAPCLAVTGAGGKTSLIAEVAESLAACGRSSLIAPTTRIFVPRLRGSAPNAREEHSPQICDAILLRSDKTLNTLFSELHGLLRRGAPACVALGEDTEQSPLGRKLRGLPPEDILYLKSRLEDSFSQIVPLPVFLVEADGAARRPLKAHAPHEPVIPSCANVVVAVMGLDAPGKALADAAHRPELAAALLGVELDAAVTPAMAAALLLHPAGPFCGTPPDAARVVLLNKTDALSDPAQRRALLQALTDALRVPGGPDEILTRGLS